MNINHVFIDIHHILIRLNHSDLLHQIVEISIFYVKKSE